MTYSITENGQDYELWSESRVGPYLVSTHGTRKGACNARANRLLAAAVQPRPVYGAHELAAAQALYEHESGPDAADRRQPFESLAEPTVGAYVDAVRAVVSAWIEAVPLGLDGPSVRSAGCGR